MLENLTREHIIYTLGIDVSLNENEYISSELHEAILREQLLYETFLDSIKQYVGGKLDKVVNTVSDLKDAATVIGQAFSNAEILTRVTALLQKQLSNLIEPFLKLIQSIGLQTLVNKVNDLLKNIFSLEGWKKLLIIIGVGSLITYVISFLKKNGLDFAKSGANAVAGTNLSNAASKAIEVIREKLSDFFDVGNLINTITSKLTDFNTYIGYLKPIVDTVENIINFIKPVTSAVATVLQQNGIWGLRLMKEKYAKIDTDTLLNKVILEWSYRTKKGYPDINNEEDMRVFESMFGFDLNEVFNRSKSIAAAQDFVDSSAAKELDIKKFKSGKYANRLNSVEVKDLNVIKLLLSKHFNIPEEDIILHEPGQGLAAKDSVPGFQLNTNKYGDVFISVSTGKKGTGGLKAEAALANGVNNFTKGIDTITVKLTDGQRDAIVKGVMSAKQVGAQTSDGSKADVSFYAQPDGKGTPIGNISVKEDGRSSSEFRWASANNDKTPFRKAFVDKALNDKSFPIELRRTGHHLDTDKSPKYAMYKRGTDERVSIVVVRDAPTDANEDYLFGTDQPKTIIVQRSFKEEDFHYDDNTGVLTVKCSSVYTDISQIQGTEVEPAFTVTQHQKQPYGLDFRIVPESKAKYGPKASGVGINYTDVF